MTKVENGKSDKEIRINQSYEEEPYKNEPYKQFIPDGFTSSPETIQIPKIIVPNIEIMAQFTHKSPDTVLTDFIVDGIAIYFQEPERFVEAIKNVGQFFKRFELYFDKGIYEEPNIKSTSSQPQKKNGKHYQTFPFTMVVPEHLIHCIKTFSISTNREREDLLRSWLMGQLQWLYGNPEYLPEFLQGHKEFYERLRMGLNMYYGKEVFKRKNKQER